MAGDHTCGARIDWVKSSRGYTDAEAKALASSEYPTECGACAPTGVYYIILLAKNKAIGMQTKHTTVVTAVPTYKKVGRGILGPGLGNSSRVYATGATLAEAALACWNQKTSLTVPWGTGSKAMGFAITASGRTYCNRRKYTEDAPKAHNHYVAYEFVQTRSEMDIPFKSAKSNSAGDAKPSTTTFTKVAIAGTPSCTDVEVTLSVNDFRYASTTDSTTHYKVVRLFNFPNANGFGNIQSCILDSPEFPKWSPTTIIDLRGTPFVVKGGVSAFLNAGYGTASALIPKCHSSNQYCEYKLTGSCGHTLWKPVLSVIDACLFCNSLGKFYFSIIHLFMRACLIIECVPIGCRCFVVD